MEKAKTPKECNEILGKAFNEGDTELAMSLFEEGAIFTDIEGKEHIGLMAIEEAEQAVIDLHPKFTIETTGVTQFEDVAVLRSKWRLEGKDPDGKPIEMSHNGVEVVRRGPDGSWRYIINNPFFAD